MPPPSSLLLLKLLAGAARHLALDCILHWSDAQTPKPAYF